MKTLNKNKMKTMTKERWAYYQKEIKRLRKLDKEITDRVRATYSIKKKNKND